MLTNRETRIASPKKGAKILLIWIFRNAPIFWLVYCNLRRLSPSLTHANSKMFAFKGPYVINLETLGYRRRHHRA